MAIFPVAAIVEQSLGSDETYEILLPGRIDGMLSLERKRQRWEPTYHGAGKENRASYRYQGYDFAVLTINYPEQSQGAEMIFRGNSLFDKRRWVQDFEVDLASRDNYRLLALRGQRGGSRVIGYWYEVGGISTTSDSVAKVLDILGAFTRNTGASVVAVAINGRYEQVAEPLDEFVGRLQGALQDK